MSEEAMDEVLERLRGTGVDVRNTVMPNHAPMAAEALCAMGHGHAALAWVEKVRERLLPLPPAKARIDSNRWAEALGDPARIRDWLTFFRRVLEEEAPFSAVATWVPRLMPGIFSGGGHGLIRVGHAVRSLENRVTPLRTDELALSLAYWASDFRSLPGTPWLEGTRDFATAAAHMPRVLTRETRSGVPRVLILHAGTSPEFGPAVEAATAPAEPEVALTSLAALGVRLYLDHAATQPLVFLHAVTAPASLALLLPHLRPQDRRLAVGYAWQASAAWISTFDDRDPPAPTRATPPPSPEALMASALGTGDAHALKFTEACTRLHRQRPEREFLDAASDFCARVEAAEHWSLERKRSVGMKFD